MPTFAGSGQAGAFEIVALEGVGDLVQPGDTFNLVGRALPYRGFSFEVTQRIQTTWYPGNPVASQQALGATESNTTVQGTWKDRYLFDADPFLGRLVEAPTQNGDGLAMVLARNFELLCRYAVPVEVRWGTGFADGVPFGVATVRRGLIKRFKWTPDRPQDVAWEMEFEWRGNEQTAAKPVAVRLMDARQQLAQVVSQFDDTSNALKDVREKQRSLLFGLVPAFQDAMKDLTTTLDKTSQQLADTVAGVVGGIHADGGLLENGNALYAVAILQGSVDTLALAKEQLEALPLYTLSVRDDALDLLSSLGDLLGLNQEVAACMETAANTRDDLAAQTFTGVIAEVSVAAGSDLRDLALKYYGDPDLWYTIARYNGLATSRVPALPDGPSDRPARLVRVPQRNGSVSSVGDAC